MHWHVGTPLQAAGNGAHEGLPTDWAPPKPKPMPLQAARQYCSAPHVRSPHARLPPVPEVPPFPDAPPSVDDVPPVFVAPPPPDVPPEPAPAAGGAPALPEAPPPPLPALPAKPAESASPCVLPQASRLKPTKSALPNRYPVFTQPHGSSRDMGPFRRRIDRQRATTRAAFLGSQQRSCRRRLIEFSR